jgi:hypothetical protein
MARFRSRGERPPLSKWFTLGAGLMYFLDPDNGKRRRALLRDQLLHLSRVGKEALGRTGRDLANRAHGLSVRLERRTNAELPDEILIERVRSKMGVFVSHPHALEIHVENAVVTLSGPILRREAQPFTRRLRRMAGVRAVVDRLDRHGPDDHVSALQGGALRRRRPEFLQNNWAPAARLIAGAAGFILLASGRSTRSRPLAAIGAALLLRALANRPLKDVIRSVRSQVFAKRGAGSATTLQAPPSSALAPAPLPPEPTPIEQAEEVARSIRE